MIPVVLSVMSVLQIAYHVWGRLLFCIISNALTHAPHLSTKVIVSVYLVNLRVRPVHPVDQLHAQLVIPMILPEDIYFKVRDVLPPVILGIILIQAQISALSVFLLVRRAPLELNVTAVFSHHQTLTSWEQLVTLHVHHCTTVTEINVSNAPQDALLAIRILVGHVSRTI